LEQLPAMMKSYGKREVIAVLQSKYAIVVAEAILLAFFTFGTFSVLVRLTDIKTIGLWVLLNSLLSFSRMADFWSTGLVSFVAQSVAEGQRQKAANLVSTAIITGAAGYLLLVAIVGPVIYIFAGAIPGVEDKEQVRLILPLMCLTFWLLSVAATYQIGFLGFDRPGYKVIQTVGGAAMFLLLSVILVPHNGIWGILLAQAIQAFLMLAYGFSIFQFGVVRGAAKFRWYRQDFNKLARFGSKAVVVSVLQIAVDPLIRLLVSHFGGLAAVTLVELATRAIVAVRGLILSVGQLLVPAFARASTQQDDATGKLFLEARTNIMLVTIPSLSCLLSLAPLMERLMLGDRQPLFVPMLWLLCLGWGVNTIISPSYFLLTGHRRLWPLFWNRLMMLVAVGVLGRLGGLAFGVMGVVAGITTGLVLSSIILLLATREFKGKTERKLNFWSSALWLMPVLMAGMVNLICKQAELWSFGLSTIYALGITGSFLTILVSFMFLPLRSLLAERSGLSHI
jgi:O-antigen/teichoic acid export membrane protein